MTSKTVEDILATINSCETLNKNALVELSACDRRENDILHELELVDLSYHEKAKLACELTDIRKKRRIAKNTIELLAPIIQWRQEQAGPLTKLSTVLGKMRKIEEKQANVVYFRRGDDSKGDIIAHKE